MKLGILSDTHGHVERTRKAIELLKGAKVDQYIHCGDIGSEEVLYTLVEELELESTPLTAVWGNVDRWDTWLYQFPVLKGLTIKPDQAQLDLAGQNAMVIHGDDSHGLQSAIASGEYDLIFTGHTHVAADQTQGQTRVINPGAVYRASRPSVAVLDVTADQLEFLYLDV